jgi:glycosyltransferase involved in cell wall biosynthesis
MSVLHLVALPHVKLGTAETCLCAYSGKCEKFVRMMKDRHEVVVYGVEGPELPGATLVQCLSDAERVKTFGADDPNRLPDWPTDAQSLQFNLNAAAELQKRAKPDELILLSGGLTNLPIFKALPGRLFCEPFVGYFGVIGGNSWAAFESYFHMSQTYCKNGTNDIRWFDTVVPPFCDKAEFPNVNTGNGDYLLFVGRLISRKGPTIALEIAKAAGLPLYVAGSGGRMEGDVLVGQDVRLDGNVKYFGPVGVEKRSELMSGAIALVCPTTYFEPGGNIAIEAMMAGTPVIAPDSGVFSETVQDGVSGFHFRMLREAVEAVKLCDTLDPEEIRKYASDRYSLEAIAPRFEHWFENLRLLFGKGWYSE